MVKPLYVRCADRMVFRIYRDTLAPATASHYDAHCFSDPRADVDYMEHSEWVIARQEQARAAIARAQGEDE